MGMLAITFIGLTLLAATVALFSVALAASTQHPQAREDLAQLRQILQRLVHQLVAAGVLVGGLGAMIALACCGLVLLNGTLSGAPESARTRSGAPEPALAAAGPVRNIPAISRPAPEEQPADAMIARSPGPIADPDMDQPAADRHLSSNRCNRSPHREPRR